MTITLDLIWNDSSETSVDVLAWDVFNGQLVVTYAEGDSEAYEGLAFVTCYVPGSGLVTLALSEGL